MMFGVTLALLVAFKKAVCILFVGGGGGQATSVVHPVNRTTQLKRQIRTMFGLEYDYLVYIRLKT